MNNLEEQNLVSKTLKTTFFDFVSLILTRGGSFVFTIILARLLLPELFGAYNLVLSIVLVFVAIADFGVNSAVLKYVSERYSLKKTKAKSYLIYLFKIKLILIIGIIFLILIMSHFFAISIFKKPILFYPLIFSTLYVLLTSFKDFFTSILFSLRKASKVPFMEISFQLSRIIFVVLAIHIFNFSFHVSGVILSLVASSFISIIIFFIIINKERKIFNSKTQPINKKGLFKYLKYSGIAGLTILIFGSVDTLMLGLFVGESFIGFYRVALSIVINLSSLFLFSRVLLPVFSNTNSQQFKRGFGKVFRYYLIFTIPLTIGLIVLSKYVIFVLFGQEYLPSSKILYFLSFITILFPLSSLYNSIFQARGQTKILAILTILALGINIFLNFIFIKLLMSRGTISILLGVAFATIFSRFINIHFLYKKAKKDFGLHMPKKTLLISFVSGGIMGFFLFLINIFLDMNLFFGILEIIFGAGIYFGLLYLFKEIKEEDILILNIIFTKFKQRIKNN